MTVTLTTYHRGPPLEMEIGSVFICPETSLSCTVEGTFDVFTELKNKL